MDVREVMVENAVTFLLDENVKKAPLMKRIAFLETKGLNSAEINEALSKTGEPHTVPSILIQAPMRTNWKDLIVTLSVGAAFASAVFFFGKVKND